MDREASISMYYRIVLDPETGYQLIGEYRDRKMIDMLLEMLRTEQGCNSFGLWSGPFQNVQAIEVYESHDYPRVCADMRGRGI